VETASGIHDWLLTIVGEALVTSIASAFGNQALLT
jgi:hypothetical protein